ncbi:3'(2'),5'-bisphosphate nucleotidase CysQ [Mangrovicella endophytica]|uniref:3'(2'),5'-bisphosphate nucleotidase CysQ n=1 Tax=Mangrovicella endophytica TaxID=2066697 RepID=UPI000C9E3E9A|nr:3'(2'),5'-bisphosphate nucleotidase CysQ [Mangrovicella endophytica]
MASDATAELELITAAAREAAAIAMGFFRRDPKVWWKEGNSPVSEADFAADNILRETLLGARPGYGWLSEETPVEAAAHTTERFFVIDPIDGTRAFLRGEETWCVSVAVIENGRPIAGVIDAPALGEVFVATAGGPALLNGVPLSVSAADDMRPLHVALPDTVHRKLGRKATASLSLAPSVPSLAYRLVMVADGRLDGTVIRPRANDWDIAAGDLILERAGGSLCDLQHQPRHYRLEGKEHGYLFAAADHAVPAIRALALDAEAR